MNESAPSSFGDFMSQLETHFTRLVSESYKAPTTMLEHLGAFASAVDWSETWIRCLVVFHLFCALVALFLRKNVDVQTALFFILCVLIYFSENLNSYCRVHWREFSKQDYFDKAGVFAGIMYSGPLLLVLFIQLVSAILY
jgi:hypothetical protein